MSGPTSLAAQAARFLLAAGHEQTAQAKAMLEAEPRLATFSVHTAAVVGDAEAVAKFVAEDGSLATKIVPPDETEPIIYAAMAGLKQAIATTEAAHVATMRALLDAGASANASVPLEDVSERIPVLYFPCVSNSVAVARLLLERGANPNVASYGDHEGHPPLHRAAASGFGADVLRMLVEHGALVNTRRADGATAYALCVRSGNVGAAAYLASVGADITQLTAIHRLLGACATLNEAEARAIIASHPDIIDTLSESDREALSIAVTDNRIDVVRLMLSLGWPLTQDGEWGGTPLHWAAWNGRVDIVKLLLQHGAPVNQRDSRYGSSPVGWVSHGSVHCDRGNDADYPAIVDLLLDAGATRPESFNQWNESPESMARPSVVQALRDRGFLT